jgi:hypothetical protein
MARRITSRNLPSVTSTPTARTAHIRRTAAQENPDYSLIQRAIGVFRVWGAV